MPEVPRVVLKSEDSLLQLLAGPSRLDLCRQKQADETEVNITAHLNLASRLFAEYLDDLCVEQGRIACVVTRTAPSENPAQAISRHFVVMSGWKVQSIDRPDLNCMH